MVLHNLPLEKLPDDVTTEDEFDLTLFVESKN